MCITPARILSQAQAEAVYSAMCALNNVGATINAKIPPTEDGGRWVFVEECEDSGQITLTTGLRRAACHSSQAEFAAAYGLQAGVLKSSQYRIKRVDPYPYMMHA